MYLQINTFLDSSKESMMAFNTALSWDSIPLPEPSSMSFEFLCKVGNTENSYKENNKYLCIKIYICK